MGNNLCPVPDCNESTAGKAVRGFNFCEAHRNFAVFVRDSKEVQQHEKTFGKSLWGEDFLRNLIAILSVADEEGCGVVGI